MNSEELEQSLKGEFENYINGLLAEIRGDVAEFQAKIEAEMEKHRSNLDAAFQGLSTRFERAPEFDGGFKESVIEHLRLARDEGATITATAIAEAAELEKASAPEQKLGDIKKAIDDISSKDSQSSILKALIQHAADFTPRGAFFIIKNGQFVGWKVFGKETGDGEASVRDIHFPVSDDSIVGKAVNSLAPVEASSGSYSDDHLFLDPLQFGKPDRMYAIPLIARGRGVAVLYADYGHEGITVNTDALEMLVKVAGLTVEVLANSRGTQGDGTGSHEEFGEAHAEPAPSFESRSFEPPPVHDAPAPQTFSTPFAAPAAEPVHETPHFEPPHFEPPVQETPANQFDFRSSFDTAQEYRSEEPQAPAWTPPAATEPAFEPPRPAEPVFEPPVSNVPAFEHSEPQAEHEPAPAYGDFAMSSPAVEHEAASPMNDSQLSAELRSFDPAVVPEPPPVVEPAIVFSEPQPAAVQEHFDPTPFSPAAEPVQTTAFPAAAPASPVVEQVAVKPLGSRLSDRQVDLPIEVADDERRLHNDARRFARLLVSEIKLYNEKKVQEGREASDLYERLREAIDRSREMYDKRVQTPVSSKFDYFHYELVNALAEGDVSRLGPRYPGPTV